MLYIMQLKYSQIIFSLLLRVLRVFMQLLKIIISNNVLTALLLTWRNDDIKTLIIVRYRMESQTPIVLITAQELILGIR